MVLRKVWAGTVSVMVRALVSLLPGSLERRAGHVDDLD